MKNVPSPTLSDASSTATRVTTKSMDVKKAKIVHTSIQSSAEILSRQSYVQI
jgi:hypothetical protein